MMIKTYSELISIPTFEGRFEYLKIGGGVGISTFGGHRYLNQLFYSSKEWRDTIRNKVIVRDNSCDLAVADRPIYGRVYIHHLNPVHIEDLATADGKLLDLENLVCVSFDTHQAIHYGDKNLLMLDTYTERKPWDTCPWRRGE